MSIAKVFKSAIPSVNYIFGNGKPAIFVNGKFATTIESEIAELENEIRLGHPHIYIDENEKEIDSSAIDPISSLRAQIEKEIMDKMAAATNPENDMGTSEQEKLKVATSADVAQAAQGGSGTSLAARLVNLTGAKA